MMSRIELHAAVERIVGTLLREPTEAEWELLEDRLVAATRRIMPASQRSFAELLKVGPGQAEVSRWAREIGAVAQ